MTDTDTLTRTYRNLRVSGTLRDIGERLAKEILNGNFVAGDGEVISSCIEYSGVPARLRDTRHFRQLRLRIAIHCSDYLEQFDTYPEIISTWTTITWCDDDSTLAIVTSHVIPGH